MLEQWKAAVKPELWPKIPQVAGNPVGAENYTIPPTSPSWARTVGAAHVVGASA